MIYLNIYVIIAVNSEDHYWKSSNRSGEVNFMLRWAVIFLIIALIAGVLGISGVAGTAAYIAKILFVIFIVLFIVSLVMGRRGPKSGL